jgi:hypothetical protein
MTKQKTTNGNSNFSEILNEMRNLAMAITKDKRVRVKYIPSQPTSSFNMETYEIALSLESYPEFVRKFPRLFRKVLDGDMGHECGHLILTRPNWEFFNNWATKIKRQRGFYKLAHEICYDKLTEVLTKNGWKFFKDITLEDEIATITKEGFIEYQNPLKVIRQRYDGMMYHWDGDHIDEKVTPDHELIIRKKWKENFERIPAFALAEYKAKESYEFQIGNFKWKGKSPKTIIIGDKNFPIKDGLSLIAWYVSEGHLGYYNRSYRTEISNTNPIYRNEIRSLVSKYWNFVESPSNINFTISNKSLFEFLSKECGKGSHNKKIPQFVKNLSSELIEYFLNELFKGDGNFRNKKIRLYSTVSPKLSDDVQELVLKIGLSGVVIYNNPKYTITVNHEKLTPCCTKEVKKEEYHGIVYDVRVPNHTLIVRRNGKVVLGSNCNIVEDKRVNHFIILRYRFDIGKRLLLANLILKDMMDNEMEEHKIIANVQMQSQMASLLQGANVGNVVQLDAGESLDFTVDSKGHTQTTSTKPNIQVQSGKQDGVYMVAILCNQGLYEAKCTQLWKQLTPEGKKDCEQALKVLERVKYKRIKLDLIRSCQEIYDLVAKHLKADYTTKEYVCSRRGGNIKGTISDKLKQLLEAEEQKEEKEEEEKKQKEDLAKGSGAGEGTGDEIPAPEPNFEAYESLLDECKPEISQLLNQLKKLMKPRVQREIFQKRGRMMSPIIPRIYTNSFRGTIKNVYLRTTAHMEKEQVCIQFDFDFSGSVDKHEAEKITTVLNETFGHYVDDYGYGITCFGADTQKIKTPFETFENTRARIGGISVNSAGTELAVAMEANLKMFNSVKGERRKILVIASDFSLSDEKECEELMTHFAKAGIEVILIGFCNCDNYETIWQNVKGLKIKRTEIKQIADLPQHFLDVYLNCQK